MCKWQTYTTVESESLQKCWQHYWDHLRVNMLDCDQLHANWKVTFHECTTFQMSIFDTQVATNAYKQQRMHAWSKATSKQTSFCTELASFPGSSHLASVRTLFLSILYKHAVQWNPSILHVHYSSVNVQYSAKAGEKPANGYCNLCQNIST